MNLQTLIIGVKDPTARYYFFFNFKDNTFTFSRENKPKDDLFKYLDIKKSSWCVLWEEIRKSRFEFKTYLLQ